MSVQMKGITCCIDCVYYNSKKHCCSRGCKDEWKATDHFYADCPLPDVVLKNHHAEWISVKDRLPETGMSVLVNVKIREGKSFVCTAAHVGAKEVNSESYGWEDTEVDFDYEEDTDTYWIPECWYETNLVENNTNWIIDEYADGVVTHWMPLPEPPC